MNTMTNNTVRKEILFYIILLGLTLFYYYPIITAPFSVQDGYDMTAYYYPYWYFMQDSLEKFGEVPLWNSSIMCGTTIIGNAHFSYFYPPNWLLFILPLGLAFNIWFALHILLAGIGCFLLLRYFKLEKICALYGSIIYMFGGHVAVRIDIGHYHILSTIAIIPFAFLFLQRLLSNPTPKRGVQFGLILGIKLLTLHLQMFYYSIIFMMIYSIIYIALRFFRDKDILFRDIRKFCVNSIMAGVIALALCSAQLIYIMKASAYSHRAGRSYELFSKISLPLRQVLGIFFPDPWGTGLKDNRSYVGSVNYWELSAFIGFSVLLFVILSFRKRNSALNSIQISGIIMLIIAMGKYTPLGKFVYHLPFMSYTRAPSRFIILVVFSMACSAAFGLNSVIKNRENRSEKGKSIRNVFIFIGCIIVFLVLALQVFPEIGRSLLYPPPIDQNIEISNFTSGYVIYITLIFSPMIFFFILYRKNIIKPLLYAVLMLTVLIGELFIYGNRLINPVSEEQLKKGYKLLKRFETENGEFYRVKVSTTRDQIGYTIHGIGRVYGYEAFVNKDFFDMLIDIRNILKLSNEEYQKYVIRLYKYLNTKYIIDTNRRTIKSLELEEKPPTYVVGKRRSVYLYKNYMPRVYFAKEVFKSENLKEFYNYILTNNMNEEYKNNKAKIQIAKYEPNMVAIKIDAPSEGYVVLLDTYFPGWKAYIDGIETKIIKANYTFRALKISKGEHKILFKYRPTELTCGIIISLLTVLLLLSNYIYSGLKKKIIFKN